MTDSTRRRVNHNHLHPQYQRGAGLVENLMRQLMEKTNGYITLHSSEQLTEEGLEIHWCLHTDPNTQEGCIRPTIVEVLIHVLDEHTDDGRCIPYY